MMVFIGIHNNEHGGTLEFFQCRKSYRLSRPTLYFTGEHCIFNNKLVARTSIRTLDSSFIMKQCCNEYYCEYISNIYSFRSTRRRMAVRYRLPTPTSVQRLLALSFGRN